MSKLSFEPTECDGSPREFVGMHRPTFQDFWHNAQADPGAYQFGAGVYPNRARESWLRGDGDRPLYRAQTPGTSLLL